MRFLWPDLRLGMPSRDLIDLGKIIGVIIRLSNFALSTLPKGLEFKYIYASHYFSVDLGWELYL